MKERQIMRRFLRPGGVALALVLLAGGPASTAVRAADPTPDLKIELVGLPLSNTQRELQVRVTNVSNNVWAQESTARIETVKPTAGNVVKDIFVENLDPGQSTTFKYTLDADCNGHEVKAEVSAGKNYAGEPESGQ